MTDKAKRKPAAATKENAANIDPAADGPANGESAESPDTVADSGGAESPPDYPALAAELNDKLLRAVAELENYRRRAEKERQDTAKFAISGFARDCLTVLDNLRRGLDSVSKEDRDGNPALETLASGMELTERELIATLDRHGIKKVDPMGEPFDYDRHQAMFEVEDSSRPAGTVVEVVQPGYLLNDRLLRPAMVAVAKGGPKPGAAAPAPKETEGGPAGDASDDADGHVDTKA